jgi:hypothetical protein
MATVTASVAANTYVAKGNHVNNIVAGNYAGALSLSGSSRLLMAKVPANAKSVQLIVRHVSGASTGVMNYGIRNGAGDSATVSALGSSIASGVTHISPPLDLTWDDANGERVKYVVASAVSGTVTASLSFSYQVTYIF